MKHFLLTTLLLLGSFQISLKAQCLEITSILINACDATSDETDNEMVTFTVGPTALNVTDIDVNWPNIGFQGFCTSATATAGLNATITNGCGYLLEPPGGIIPANANVILVTSTNVSTIDNTFQGLSDTLYILYQCDGNGAAQFVNQDNSAPTTRTTYFSITGPCSQTEIVTYDGALLNNIDGERVYFDDVGNTTYDDTKGCTAPVDSYSDGWIFTDEICNNYGDVDLNSLLSSGTTTGGIWSGPRVTGSTYNPNGYLGLDSITYTVNGSTSCATALDSTIVFNVVEPQTGTETIEVCDSTLINGIWYDNDTTFTSTITNSTPYACDSLVDYTVIISPLSQDSSFIFSCDSVELNGMWYSNDTILRDTILAGSGGSTVIDTILETSFEDSEGWMDQATGSWTHTDAYGTWSANGMYANQYNPNTGNRNIGMNDVGDWLEFPPIDNPQTLYYFDRLSGAVRNTNEYTIQYYNGTTWVDINSDTCTHTNYEQVTIDLSIISNLTNVSIRILRTQHDRSGYIDDIVITGSSIGAGSNCDSIIITNIHIAEPTFFDTIYQCTLIPSDASTTNDTIRYPSACDSLITSTIIQFIDTSAVYSYSCTNDPSLVKNDTTSIITSILGCDSIYNITSTTLVDTSSSNTSFTICDSIIYNGVTFYSDTVFTDTILSSLGCDSLYQQITITSAPNYTKIINPVICQGDSFQLPGTTQFESTSGTYTSTIVVSNSCDTSVTIHLSVTPTPIGATLNIQECNTSYTLPGTGQIITYNGSYNDTLVSSFNCDSIQPYNITFLTSDTGVINPIVCNGESFTLSDGSIVNATGSYFSNAGVGTNGCDSVVRTDLTVLSSPIFYDTIYQCTLTPTNAGILNDTIKYTTGNLCDSLITSTITQLVDTNAVYTYACTIDPSLMGNDTTSIIYSNLGCDSIYNITTTNFIDTLFTDSIINTCDSTIYNGITFTNDTTFIDTIQSALACDSIYRQVAITIIPDYTKTISSTICQGDSFLLPGTSQYENTTGTYTSIISVTNDCDTVVTTNLNVTPITVGTTIIVQECNSTYTLPNSGQVISSNGIYNDTLVSASNCDSIQPYNITFLLQDTGIINTSICFGQNYTLSDGTVVNTTGSYSSLFGTGANGCDSIIITNLTVLPNPEGTPIQIQECNDQFILPVTGQVITSDGTYNDTITTSTCDSIQPYIITFLPNYTKTVNASICQGDSFQLEGNNQFVSTAGTYTSDIIIPNDCDTTVTTILNVENPTLLVSQDTLICQETSINLNATGTPHILWSTGDTSNQITVTPLGDSTFTVRGTSLNNCTTPTESIFIEVQENIKNVFISASNQAINSGENVTIEVSADNVQSYFWTPNNNSTSTFTTQPSTSTMYVVTLSNDPCPSVLDSIFINVQQAFLAIPSGFSPNNDGVNDLFLVVNHENFEAYSLYIYNRWGELIYHQTANAAAWDGTYSGKNAEIGVYTYYIEAQLKNSDIVFEEKGNITLIR